MEYVQFDLTEKEIEKALIFIEHHLLFVDNLFRIDQLRKDIEMNNIPDMSISTEAQRNFMDKKQGPYIYMVNWTPAGYRYMVINQFDECENFTDESYLNMMYNTHSRSWYYDHDRQKHYTFNELMQIRPFTLLFINNGIGQCIRIVCNATDESENITDYEKM